MASSTIDEKKPRVAAGFYRAGGGSEKRGIARPFDIPCRISELAAPVERELHLDATADGRAGRGR